MNIPEKIRIGSCDYDVKFTQENLVNKGKECYAIVEYDNHLIEINNKLGDKQTDELSFLHEIFHAVLRERALEVEDEELIVEELAKGLHQIIRDNQEMFIDKNYFEEKQWRVNPYKENKEELNVQATE